MKIAILGGGITGLTTAYCLAKKNHRVTLFEKSRVLGGLAVGFKMPNWNWQLEKAYHHIFANDYDMINFAKEIGFNKIFFSSPETASLFTTNHQALTTNYQILPLDTPFDLLKFPLLSFPEKIRVGAVLGFLKFSPFFPFFEKQTSEEFLTKFIGKKAYSVLFQELFRKKFGDFAVNILSSFIWARINKRTKSLGYIEGGFQTLINYLVKELTNFPAFAKTSAGKQTNLLTSYEIKNIEKQGDKFLINNQVFDIIISTLPSPITAQIGEKIFPAYFLQKLRKLKYLHALTLILETKKPLLEKTYWLNVTTPKIPIMAIVQHTNFIDKKHYGENHITYLGWYLKKEDKLFALTKKELVNFVKPYLKILNSKFLILNSYDFRGFFAQPIFDKNFVKNKPDFVTPVENFFIANLDMTYPYDRGTNYAVKLGKQVAKMI